MQNVADNVHRQCSVWWLLTKIVFQIVNGAVFTWFTLSFVRHSWVNYPDGKRISMAYSTENYTARLLFVSIGHHAMQIDTLSI